MYIIIYRTSNRSRWQCWKDTYSRPVKASEERDKLLDFFNWHKAIVTWVEKPETE
jgi:hypothetical protein